MLSEKQRRLLLLGFFCCRYLVWLSYYGQESPNWR